MKRVILTLAMVGVWCVTVLPVHAADDDARVLILNGLDPYLPAYLAIDNAMRTSLAKESTDTSRSPNESGASVFRFTLPAMNEGG